MQLPPLPQLAVVGRSNVGKSSLINALARRKNLAKTSATPGKTRSINLYRVQPDGLYLVDLPGYGYARCSQAERNAWAQLIEAYLSNNSALRGLIVLLDCRIPPQKLDMDLIAYAESRHIPLLPVLTKADAASVSQREKTARAWAHLLGKSRPPLMVSARTGLHLGSLWQAIRALATGDPLPPLTNPPAGCHEPCVVLSHP